MGFWLCRKEWIGNRRIRADGPDACNRAVVDVTCQSGRTAIRCLGIDRNRTFSNG